MGEIWESWATPSIYVTKNPAAQICVVQLFAFRKTVPYRIRPQLGVYFLIVLTREIEPICGFEIHKEDPERAGIATRVASNSH